MITRPTSTTLLNGLLTEEQLAVVRYGGISIAALGDSTFTGAGVNGYTYGEQGLDARNGWPNWFFHELIRHSRFIPLSSDVWPIVEAGKTSFSGVSESWHATATASQIEFKASEFVRDPSNRFTIYYHERTAAAALRFRVTIQNADGLQIGQQVIDTYTAPIDFGSVTTSDVAGRLSKDTVQLDEVADDLTVTIDQFEVVDRGGGPATNGTAIIYGFAFGDGVTTQNLAVASSTLTAGSAANDLRGITTQGQLQKAFDAECDIFILGWGTNDSKTGVTTVSQFKKDYSDLIDQIRSTRPSAVVVLCTAPPGQEGSVHGNNGPFNQAIASVAENKNALLFDVAAIEKWPGYEIVDTVHPNKSGIQITADALAARFGFGSRSRKMTSPASTHASGGEFIIPEGGNFTSQTAVVSETIQRPVWASRVSISAKIGVAKGTETVQAKAVLKIGSVIVDESIASFPEIGTISVGQVLVSANRPATSDSVAIELLVDDLQIRSGNSISKLEYQWHQ